jgi:hypothetical protein
MATRKGNSDEVPSIFLAPSTPEEREERIRVRAYALYRHRKAGDGAALDDWLQAEREMDEHQEEPLSSPLVRSVGRS